MKKLFTLGLSLVLASGALAGCSAQPAEGTTTSAFDKEVDVLVIGGGGAGLSAALEAADNGAESVTVLEKLGRVGGTTFISQGMIAGYQTEYQKANGVEDITFDQMYANLMKNCSYRLDQDLTKITVESSKDTINWLEERVKLPFGSVVVGYGPYQMMHVVEGFGPAMYDPYVAALDEAGVEILTETKGETLITDDNGAVIGATASTADGEIKIGAKSVVIATGGYSMNPELTARLDPEYEGTFGIGHPAATGDGLIMANNIGATLSHTNDIMFVLKDYEIMKDHNGNSGTATVSKYMGMPNVVMVGADGKRFMNEKSGGYMSQELNRPVFQQIHKDGTGYVWALCDVATTTAAEVKRGSDMEFMTAETIEDLAAQMGVDAANLKASIDTYNEACDKGFDMEFGRTALAKLEAPYTAVKVVPCEIITYGGLVRNEKAEVLKADGTAIANLYAAGEVTSNSAYMGFTISNAVTWGRIAGASAAANLK